MRYSLACSGSALCEVRARSSQRAPTLGWQGLGIGILFVKMTETIEARGHTTRDGMLNLSVNVGVANADVSVVVHVKPLAAPANWMPTAGPRGSLSASPARCRN